MTFSKIYFNIFLILIAFLIINSDTSAQYSVNIHEDNGRHKIKIKNKRTSFEVEYEGTLQISADDKDIIGISDGGYFEVKKSAFGSKRRIFIDANRNGVLTKRFYVGRREKDYEPEGRKWLAEMLPEVVRNSTIAAESRVNRMYQAGGAKAVLSEIERLESDYVSVHYIGLLMNKGLADNELTGLIKMAGQTIQSDHYLSSLLRENRQQFLKNQTTINAYIDAAATLDSDHYMSEVMRDAITDGKIDQNQVESLLDITKSIQSDHYLSEVFRTLISEREVSKENLTKMLALSSTVQSDHYKSDIIREVMDSGYSFDQESLQIVLNGMEDIQSDHYATEIIKDIYDQNLSDAMVAQVIEYMRDHIQSEHYTTESLKTIIKKYSIGENGISAAIETMKRMGSEHYVGEIIKRLSKEDDITENQLIKLLDFIGTMNSDHYLTQGLKSLSHRVNECGDQVADAYRKAARNINSETEYGRALRAIER